jgi:hypothetical protein
MATDSYTIVGGQPVCGVQPGGTLTQAILKKHDADVEFLLATGHIAPLGSDPSAMVPAGKPKRPKAAATEEGEVTDG